MPLHDSSLVVGDGAAAIGLAALMTVPIWRRRLLAGGVESP